MTTISGTNQELASSIAPQPIGDSFYQKLRVLRNKRILVISPQPWEHLKVSKHHYAEELARENEVVFLEPPKAAGLPSLTLAPHPTIERLQIASWQPLTPKLLRFHAYPFYRWAMRRNAAWLAAQLGGVDVVWCFDFNVFPDLDAFRARFRIFHPVDPLNSMRQIAIANSADLVISVSERILSNFKDSVAEDRRLLVNHGLSGPFAELSMQQAPQLCCGSIRCGYFGNLDRAVINLEILSEIIRAHPEVEFHFWGPFRHAGSFSSKIALLPNVKAHGPVEKTALAKQAAEMDLFVLAYRDHPTESDRSNAHKLLEYMSTGRPIVSTRMDCYANDEDLIQMSQSVDDSDFPDRFRATIDQVSALNAPELVAKRKKFCSQFTYTNNVFQIDSVLSTKIPLGLSTGLVPV